MIIIKIDGKKIIKTLRLSLISFFVLLIISIFIDKNTIHGSDYYTAKSVIKSGDLIGLDFEQCYDELYVEHRFNVDVKLISIQGKIHKMFKDIDYFYYTSFYACSAIDGHDGRRKDYLYDIYFNENKEVVYVELVPEKAP